MNLGTPLTSKIDLCQELRVSDDKHTFATFKQTKGTELAFKAFKALAEGATDKPFLFTYGPVGNGKTHLVEALILRWWERGINCRYFTVYEMIDRIKAGIPDDATFSADEVVQALSTQKRLVMDDLGVEYETPFTQSKLEQIVDSRYRARLVTVMTTNKDLSQLSERIISRFSDPEVSQFVLNSARDYRRRNLK